jgi:tRNA 2-selenouridine synthase
MPESIDIHKFLELRTLLPVFDARSEGEYAHAHIPGAISLPLLNNEEREKVGTCYKQKGREEAVLLGFDLVGGKFGEYIRKAKEITQPQPFPKGRGGPTHSLLDGKSDGKVSPVGGDLEGVVVYCWRGGMRSNIMAWLLENAGMKVHVLQGGYKTYRHWALNEFAEQLNLLVLGGKTGSGKTEVLHEMKKAGEQVIDLEGLAHHRGSAFGALGQPAQSTSEQFENYLALELLQIDRKKILWLENESSKIGGIKIPDEIYNKMRATTVVEIEVPLENRIQNIARDYASFPKEKLAEATKRIEKKLGNKNMNDGLNYLNENDFYNWIKILLDYYDKAYTFSKSQRAPGTVLSIPITAENHAEIAAVVIDFVKQMKNNSKTH